MQKFQQHLLASLFILTGALAAPAMAKGTPELSDRTFKTVNKVQELIATEKYTQAIDKLETALERTKSRKYDRAVLLQQMGFLYSMQDNYSKASQFFAKSLAEEALPVPVAQQVRYSLAQLYLAEEQFQQSVNAMKLWFEVAKTTEEKPSAHAYITLASGYVQMEDYKNAIPPVKQAIVMSPTPSESWYMLLMASHYELKQFKSVAGVLKTLTSKYPQKKRYWMQLSGVYMELNQERNSLATLESAYKLGLFDEEKEFLRLANFQAYRGIPFRAAKTLKQEMANGNISNTVKHLDKLANFWLQAKELDLAITAYRSAYEQEPTARTQLKIARLMLQAQQYRQATEFALQPAPGAESGDKAELAYLRGMAHFELNQLGSALKAMKVAAQSDDMKGAAGPWVTFLQDQG
ncbi:tetratricopeptide repeat protein [Photobacterium sp. DNB22_13_2]